VADLLIDRLGHRGDGVADTDSGPVFVPLALPGERVRAVVDGSRATGVEIVAASPDRIAPACRHYGTCGGCALQHLAPGPYAAFKRRLVVDALADRGLAPEVAKTVTIAAGTRRRATFAGLLAGRGPLVGFNARGSDRIVPIDECPVALPALPASRPALEALVAVIAPRKAPVDLAVTATEAGLDVAVTGVPARGLERLRLALTDVAVAHDLARLTVGGEVVVERRPPVVVIDGVAVVLPPGGFLQASAEAEEALGRIVVAGVSQARRVADLHAGVGTFALRLARTAPVTAVDGDARAVAALDRAMRGMTARNRVTPVTRDLARRPLVEAELDRFDAVVFDPPRAGAAEQSAFLARSKVARVVAVSCNPATLARDLRTLVDGGYRIESVVPVDQFLWSAHVEAVAVLTRR
jgi:23S rRNA (uracil1939-C5)-methyltransferase